MPILISKVDDKTCQSRVTSENSTSRVGSEYNPTESIVNWLNSGKGTRHIKGHICTGPRGPKDAAPQSDTDD